MCPSVIVEVTSGLLIWASSLELFIVPEYLSLTLLKLYQLLSDFGTNPHGVWLIKHNESNENKIHCSVLFDLQQYPFQHGQPTVIHRLSGTQSNRAASVNIC